MIFLEVFFMASSYNRNIYSWCGFVSGNILCSVHVLWSGVLFGASHPDSCAIWGFPDSLWSCTGWVAMEIWWMEKPMTLLTNVWYIKWTMPSWDRLMESILSWMIGDFVADDLSLLTGVDVIKLCVLVVSIIPQYFITVITSGILLPHFIKTWSINQL